MKFSGKVGNGPMKKLLYFVGDPDPCHYTGKTCLGGGVHCPSASRYCYYYCYNCKAYIGTGTKKCCRCTVQNGSHMSLSCRSLTNALTETFLFMSKCHIGLIPLVFVLCKRLHDTWCIGICWLLVLDLSELLCRVVYDSCAQTPMTSS